MYDPLLQEEPTPGTVLAYGRSDFILSAGLPRLPRSPLALRVWSQWGRKGARSPEQRGGEGGLGRSPCEQAAAGGMRSLIHFAQSAGQCSWSDAAREADPQSLCVCLHSPVNNQA